MVAVSDETLSPHDLCSVKSHGRSAVVWPDLSGLRWYGLSVRWCDGHRQIVAHTVLGHTWQSLHRWGGSTVGFPCCLSVPGHGLCRRPLQAVTGIVPPARCLCLCLPPWWHGEPARVWPYGSL